MLKTIVISLFLILPSSMAQAVDVELRWDASSGATGYKIYKSLDLGVTWLTPIDVGNVTTYKYLNVEENILVLFRASAYNSAGESIRTWSGAWIDQRKKPVTAPTGQGIQ